MNKLFLILSIAFMFIFLSSFTSAAIAFDSSASNQTTGTSLLYSQTVTGSNTILFVGISIESVSDLVTSVTYNGLTMTRISSQSGNGETAYLYYLVGASGTHNVVINTSSSTGIRSSSSSYTGASQTGQPDNFTTNTTGSLSAINTSLKTINDNSWVISYAQSNGAGTVSAGGNVTLRSQVADHFNGIGDTNAAITPPKVERMTWSSSGANTWNTVQASFFPIQPSILVTLNSPPNGTSYAIPANTVTFNGTVSNTSMNVTNVSLFIDNQINITNTTGLNGTYLFSQTLPVGTHTWYIQAKNSTGYAFNSSVYTVYISLFIVLNNNYNTSTYETKAESFNLTINTTFTPLTASFVYNGTTYPATILPLDTGNYSIASSFDIPPILGNISFAYFWTNSMGNAQSSTYYQQVNPVVLSYCFVNPYINYSFYDESNQSSQLGSIPALTLNYWLGSGTSSLQFLYSNSSQASSYSFCLTPNNLTINSNWSISYQGTNYPIRTLENTSSVLSINTYNQFLYMLQQSSGLVVTFQVINPATQALSGVYATATRTINGADTLIGSGFTGADGGVTFFVNPLLSYTFSFSKSGYNSFKETIVPSQSGYTITLGGNSANQTDYTKGISYTINPLFGTILNTSSNYNFTFNLNSTFWTVTNFGYVIYNQDGNIINSTSSSNNGGNILTITNTTNDTSFTMNYFYLINGTYTNGSISWTVNTLTNTGYSIANIFIDLRNYLTNGSFFGLTQFGLDLIIYSIIFLLTGLISWKFGITSPGSILGVLTALVALFDIALGLLSSPVGAVPHFPSIAIGLIAIFTIIRERTG